MSDVPNLESAYGLSTPEEVKALYADWASSYDAGFGEAQGYQIPRAVVLAFIGAGGAGPVLDVGAGTGLVGEGLKATGVGPVDALDLSAEMLDVARMKGIYRAHHQIDIRRAAATLPQESYAGIVSAGTFTLGHVGPEGLAPLLDLAAPGAAIVLSVNLRHFGDAGFESALASLSHRIAERADRDIRIYDDRADAAHRDDLARLLVLRKA